MIPRKSGAFGEDSAAQYDNFVREYTLDVQKKAEEFSSWITLEQGEQFQHLNDFVLIELTKIHQNTFWTMFNVSRIVWPIRVIAICAVVATAILAAEILPV